MPGINPVFPRFEPGDPLAASFVNDLAAAVARQAQFGDRLDAMATGAGTFRRRRLPQHPFSTFRLSDPLSRGQSAAADRMIWDPEQEEWIDTETQRTLYGDFFRGYGFEDDLVVAAFDARSDRWLVMSSGHHFVRGTLDQPLESSGDATLSVTTYNEGSGLWSDSGVDVPIVEAVGLQQPVAAGEVVFATWHEQARLWIGSLVACPS